MSSPAPLSQLRDKLVHLPDGQVHPDGLWEDMEFDDDLDALGLLCPLPVLKARKRLKSLETGQVLRLQATDPAAVIDVPHFCTEQGHDLLGQEEHGNATHYFIRKG